MSKRGMDMFAFPVCNDIGTMPYCAKDAVLGVGMVTGSLNWASVVRLKANSDNNMTDLHFIYFCFITIG